MVLLLDLYSDTGTILLFCPLYGLWSWGWFVKKFLIIQAFYDKRWIFKFRASSNSDPYHLKSHGSLLEK